MVDGAGVGDATATVDRRDGANVHNHVNNVHITYPDAAGWLYGAK
jgi:hypothetical protein